MYKRRLIFGYALFKLVTSLFVCVSVFFLRKYVYCTIARCIMLTTYLVFEPSIFFLRDIPGLKHFSLRILICKGVGCSFCNLRSSLQQLNSMTSL